MKYLFKLKDNIWKMYLLKAIMWFMVAMPIIVLFFQEHGLSLTEVMILQAVYSISVALLEIPSGYIADVFGRKKTIILSTIFCFIGYLIFSNFSDFYLFALAEVLLGFGGSLMSGSDSALIYDTLLEENNKKIYSKIEGRSYAIGNFSEAIAGILGGILATSSLFLPIYIQTFILFWSIPVAFLLVEPTINTKNPMQLKFKAILDIFNYTLVRNQRLRWLIIFSASMGVATLSIAWFSQPLFKSLEIPIIYFGLLWAILNMSAGITSFNSHIIENKFNLKKIMFFITIGMVLSFISIGYLDHLFALVFVLFIYLLRGIITPLMKNCINEETNSNKRATVLSIRSFAIRISFAITAPLLGYIVDLYTLNYAFYLLGFLVFIFAFLSIYKISNTH